MGQFPFDAQNEGALIRKILKGAYTPISGPYTSALVSEEADEKLHLIFSLSVHIVAIQPFHIKSLMCDHRPN